MDREAIIEALKEGLRLALLAGVSALISFGLDKLGLMDQSNLQVMIGTTLLRSLDKWLHEWGKDLKKKDPMKIVEGGLTRF